ncbi:MAG: penicillin-binding protein 1A [Alphaproteobacteria bacterium]|nr:penicillin-binding protein 1A [Alphaproteobacteria bacterium]
MKYLWYAFLGLFSLGFLGLMAAVGLVAFIFNYYGHDLPDYAQLKNYEPQIVTRLYAGDGRLMGEFAQEKRVFVSIDNIPDLVKNAFIAAEDQNFYKHEGVDLFAIVRAGISNLKNRGSGKRPVGASTITQQVAKNFLLTNEVSYERKVKEAILAYRMERAMSKDHLLELYMNEIYLGARAYGVAAAALQYFDKPLNELTIEEAAYLAALPKAPNNYHPVRHYEAALARRNWAIERMREDGYITREQAALAAQQPLKTIARDESRVVNAPYFTEEVRRLLAASYGEDSLYGGGLVVRSTIDPHLQDIAVRTLRDGLQAYDRRHGYRGPLQNLPSLDDWQSQLAQIKRPPAALKDWRLAVVLDSSTSSAKLGFADGPEGTLSLEHAKWARKYLNEGYAQGPEITAVSQVVKAGDIVLVSPVGDKENAWELQQVPDVQGALVAMDPHTGRILAMQGGWTYDISEFNRATQAQRQPGSSFKPFVYLAGLDNGFTPATLILDAPFQIEDRPGHFWNPTNYHDDYFGPTPLRVGIEKSRNLMTVRLAHHLGVEKISEYAKNFGITDNMPLHLSNSLGAGETTLLRMVSAYAVLVNGGKKIVPTFIDRIQNRYGGTIFRHDERECLDCGPRMKWQDQPTPEIPDTREQVADPRTAYQMVSILEGVVQRGTGAAIKTLGRPLAGKTGTTNESRDTWFIGFSPDLVVGIFAGFDAPRSLGKRETGASICVPMFKSFMEEALKDVPLTPFRVPPGIRNVQINASTGARAQIGDQNVIWEAFVTGTEPTEDIFILDESGINLMGAAPSSDSYSTPAGPGSYTPPGPITGTGGLY